MKNFVFDNFRIAGGSFLSKNIIINNILNRIRINNVRRFNFRRDLMFEKLMLEFLMPENFPAWIKNNMDYIIYTIEFPKTGNTSFVGNGRPWGGLFRSRYSEPNHTSIKTLNHSCIENILMLRNKRRMRRIWNIENFVKDRRT